MIENDKKERKKLAYIALPVRENKEFVKPIYENVKHEAREYALWGLSVLSMLFSPSLMLFLGVFAFVTKGKPVSPIEFAMSLTPYGQRVGFDESNAFKSLSNSQKLVLIGGLSTFIMLDIILTSVTIPVVTTLLSFSSYGIIALGVSLLGIAAFKALELIGKALYAHYTKADASLLDHNHLVADYVRAPQNHVLLTQVVSAVPVAELGDILERLRRTEEFEGKHYELRQAVEAIYKAHDIQNDGFGLVIEVTKTVFKFLGLVVTNPSRLDEFGALWGEAKQSVTQNRGVHRVSKSDYDLVKSGFKDYRLGLVQQGRKLGKVAKRTPGDVLFSNKKAVDVRKVEDGTDLLMTDRQYAKFLSRTRTVELNAGRATDTTPSAPAYDGGY